ncbi:MAG: MFS transporter [Candidatus Lokiarchaeia archaeon]|nr:MFS transporter [Candidatus Lokiarchaeia archaeon]
MEESGVVLKKLNIGVFSLNYFVQGINQSMFTTIIPIFLFYVLPPGTLTSSQIASMMSIVLLPFGVKFIYGILSDKIGLGNLGRRKPWIIGPSILSGIVWVMFPFILTASNAIFLVTFLGVLIVIGVAMGDTAIDGLILDIYPKGKLGRVQGICWGFRSVGIIAGGPLLVILILLTGGIVEFVFIGLGIAMMIFSFTILLVKESIKKIEINAKKNLKIIFGKRKNWKVYAFSLFNAFCDGIVFVVVPLFILIQWGLVSASGASLDLIGDPSQHKLYAPQALIAFIIGLGVITGAIIGGRIADLQSRKRAVYTSFILTTISFLIFIIPIVWPVLLVFSLILGSSAGWRNSAFSAVIGQESQQYPEMDSTYYATCNSFTNLGSTIGLQLTSILISLLAGLEAFFIYAILFLTMAIIMNIGLGVFFTLNPNDYEVNLKRIA